MRVRALARTAVTAVAMAFLSLAWWCPRTLAGEEKTDSIKVSGFVLTIEDDEGKVSSVKLVVAGEEEDVTYYVTLDDNGRKLAKLDGKDVKVTGHVTVRDKARWLTVLSFKEAKEEKEGE